MTEAIHEHELMTDSEVCELLRISHVTLRKHLSDGPPSKRRRGISDDIRNIRRIDVGGSRRWVRSSVDEFINGK
jgi:hypothetical protein